MHGRRREPRFAPLENVIAEIRAADGSTPVVRGELLELSGGGLRLELPDDRTFRPDQQVQVRLLHEDDEPELLDAVIRRTRGRIAHLRVEALTWDERSLAPAP